MKAKPDGRPKRKLSDFRQQAQNLNRHTERGMGMLEQSMQEVGYAAPMVAAADGEILDGSARHETAANVFGADAEPIIVESDGKRPIVVVRTDIRDAKSKMAKRLAAYANRTGQVNLEWDAPNLEALFAEDAEAFKGLFGEDELNEILGKLEPGNADAEPQMDKAAELNKLWKVKTGDLWRIGEHRLLCGDSTKSEDVSRTVGDWKVSVAFTSPPYASQRKYDEASGFVPIKPDDYVAWWEPVQANVRSNIAEDGSYFVNIKPHCEGGERVLYVFDLILKMRRAWMWRFVDEFCWRNTRDGVPGGWNNRFKNAWEPIYHFSASDKVKFRPESVGHKSSGVFDYSPNHPRTVTGSGFIAGKPTKDGMARPSNVIEASPSMGNDHSAAFPVELPSFFIRATSDKSDVILDPFLGSGTTMVACESLKRKCCGIEISPDYCAVILQRMQDAFPKLKIERFP